MLVIFVLNRANISKTDAARITKLDIKMFHDESWRPIYFGVKSSKVKVPKHCRRGSLHSCECWFLLVSINNVRFVATHSAYAANGTHKTAVWYYCVELISQRRKQTVITSNGDTTTCGKRSSKQIPMILMTRMSLLTARTDHTCKPEKPWALFLWLMIMTFHLLTPK